MTSLHPQFIVNQSGVKASVVLLIKEYNLLLAEVEQKEEIKQYKAAKKGKLEFVDAAAAFAELDNIRASK